MARQPGGRRLRRLPSGRAAPTSCLQSRPWCSPTRTARSSSAAPSRPSPPATPTTTCSSTRSVPARESAGTQHDERLFSGVVRLFRPGYAAHLVEEWLPALDGVVEKLRAGASVADVGCGARRFHGHHGAGVRAFDVRRLRHPRAVDRGRPRGRCAGRRGPAGEVRPRVGEGTSGRGLRPRVPVRRPARHGRPGRRCAAYPGGSGPGRNAAAGRAERRRRTRSRTSTRSGRTYYGLSTVICTPGSLAQEVGLGLGAQAGERQLTTVLREAGFTHVRRATETPFNIILEARP